MERFAKLWSVEIQEWNGRDFAKLVKEGRIDQLNCEIGRLGWLVLTKSLKVKKVSGKMELRLQLKLVDPDSEEAKAYGVQ